METPRHQPTVRASSPFLLFERSPKGELLSPSQSVQNRAATLLEKQWNRSLEEFVRHNLRDAIVASLTKTARGAAAGTQKEREAQAKEVITQVLQHIEKPEGPLQKAVVFAERVVDEIMGEVQTVPPPTTRRASMEVVTLPKDIYLNLGRRSGSIAFHIPGTRFIVMQKEVAERCDIVALSSIIHEVVHSRQPLILMYHPPHDFRVTGRGLSYEKVGENGLSAKVGSLLLEAATEWLTMLICFYIPRSPSFKAFQKDAPEVASVFERFPLQVQQTRDRVWWEALDPASQKSKEPGPYSRLLRATFLVGNIFSLPMLADKIARKQMGKEAVPIPAPLAQVVVETNLPPFLAHLIVANQECNIKWANKVTELLERQLGKEAPVARLWQQLLSSSDPSDPQLLNLTREVGKALFAAAQGSPSQKQK